MQFNSSEDQTENLRKFAKIFRVHPAICGGIGWAVGRGSSSFETKKDRRTATSPLGEVHRTLSVV